MSKRSTKKKICCILLLISRQKVYFIVNTDFKYIEEKKLRETKPDQRTVKRIKLQWNRNPQQNHRDMFFFCNNISNWCQMFKRNRPHFFMNPISLYILSFLSFLRTRSMSEIKWNQNWFSNDDKYRFIHTLNIESISWSFFFSLEILNKYAKHVFTILCYLNCFNVSRLNAPETFQIWYNEQRKKNMDSKFTHVFF